MASYLQFSSGEGEILVEVDEIEAALPTGEQNAGLVRWARNQAGEAVAVARSAFEEAVRHAIRLNVPPFLSAADSLEKPPAEIEITFGLKATGEVGNLAVGKLAGEYNYQVRMVWKCGSG